MTFRDTICIKLLNTVCICVNACFLILMLIFFPMQKFEFCCIETQSFKVLKKKLRLWSYEQIYKLSFSLTTLKPSSDNPPNDNPPNDNPPKSYKRQSADTTICRHDNPPKKIEEIAGRREKQGRFTSY